MADKPTRPPLDDRLTELGEKNRNLSLLSEPATDLEPDFSLQSTLKSVASHISEVFHASGCAILLWNQDRNRLETLVDHNRVYPDEVDRPGIVYDLNDFPRTLHALKSRRPYHVRFDDPAADESEIALLKKQGIFESLALPLSAGKRILGLLEIYDDVRLKKFSKQEIRLAEALSFQAALALMNANLYEAAKLEIDDRKRVEEALRQSEQRFRAIFEQAAVGVALTSTQTGALLQVNQKYCEIVGHSAEELKNIRFQEITHPDDLQADLEKMKAMTAGKIDDYSLEKRYVRPDDSTVWVKLTVSPMRGTDDQLTQHIAVVEDISKRKAMESEVTTLSGLLPICAACKKIRDDKGYWNQIEAYVKKHSEAEFSHGLCPECLDKLYKDQKWYQKRGKQ